MFVEFFVVAAATRHWTCIVAFLCWLCYNYFSSFSHLLLLFVVHLFGWRWLWVNGSCIRMTVHKQLSMESNDNNDFQKARKVTNATTKHEQCPAWLRALCSCFCCFLVVRGFILLNESQWWWKKIIFIDVDRVFHRVLKKVWPQVKN